MTHKPPSLAQVIAASSVGTMIEFYDFFIFASLAPVLATVLTRFPQFAHDD